MTPFSPRMTASTSGVSLTQMMMISLASATAAGESAAAAPRATKGSIRLAVRFQTVRSKAGFHQVIDHAAPHDAQSDESNFLAHDCPRSFVVWNNVTMVARKPVSEQERNRLNTASQTRIETADQPNPAAHPDAARAPRPSMTAARRAASPSAGSARKSHQAPPRHSRRNSQPDPPMPLQSRG